MGSIFTDIRQIIGADNDKFENCVNLCHIRVESGLSLKFIPAISIKAENSEKELPEANRTKLCQLLGFPDTPVWFMDMNQRSNIVYKLQADGQLIMIRNT